MARRGRTIEKPEEIVPVIATVSEERITTRPAAVVPTGVKSIAMGQRPPGAVALVSYPSPEPGEQRIVRKHNAWAPTNDGVLHVVGEEVQEPKRWTMELVFAWLTEAVDTLRQLPATGCFPMGHKSGMPEPVHDLQDMIVAYGWAEIEMNYVPTASEISRMDRAIEWLYWLDPRDRVCVMGVASRMSYRTVGKQVGCDHKTARVWAEQGADRIARRLNGKCGAGQKIIPHMRRPVLHTMQ